MSCWNQHNFLNVMEPAIIAKVAVVFNSDKVVHTFSNTNKTNR